MRQAIRGGGTSGRRGSRYGRGGPGGPRGRRVADRLLVDQLVGHHHDVGRLDDRDVVGHRRSIPSSAFSDTTGLTSTTVTVGNVSTLAFGLFKGADVGTEAWADYVNSTGGINGRKTRRRLLRRRLPGRPQQAGDRGGGPEGLRRGRRVLPRGQLRRDGAGGQPRRAQRHGQPRPGDQRPAQQLQPRPGGHRVADRPAPVLQAEVPPGRAARRRPRRRRAVGHHQVERREGGHGVTRLQGRLRPAVRHHPDRLHPERGGHAPGRDQDPLPRADARELRGRRGQGAQRAGLPPPAGVRRLDLLRAAGARLRRRRRPSTAPTWRW